MNSQGYSQRVIRHHPANCGIGLVGKDISSFQFDN